MTNFNVSDRTILLVKHGSQAYGLDTPSSDLDVKGVCIPPMEYHLGFLHNFEQEELKGNEGHTHDQVVYSLKKFCKLAAGCNPALIEVLFGDDEDVLQMNAFGAALREFRQNFLSTKASHSFSGFAYSQVKKMRTHRGWLLNPPDKPPSRSEYGLSETFATSKTDQGAAEALLKDGQIAALSKEAQVMFGRERAWRAMNQQWAQYQDHLKNRNPARAALEAKCGYDSKDACHVIRLMRMCNEILCLGKVIVKRPDRDYLLNVKEGNVPYEQIVEEAETLERLCEIAYSQSPLPHHPDLNKIDQFVVRITQEYLVQNG